MVWQRSPRPLFQAVSHLNNSGVAVNNMLKTRIDVMRHGEQEGGDVLRGSTDHLLTEKGWQQARQRTEYFIARNEGWNKIISSPLSRCKNFAEELADKLQLPLEVQQDWREIDYGDWENQSTKDLWTKNAEHMQQLWADPMQFCAPNGEAVSDFTQRILSAWRQTIADNTGEKVLVVCHGGVMRILLQQLLDMSPKAMSRFKIPYAALSQFEIDHDSEKPEEKYWTSLISHHGEEL